MVIIVIVMGIIIIIIVTITITEGRDSSRVWVTLDYQPLLSNETHATLLFLVRKGLDKRAVKMKPC